MERILGKPLLVAVILGIITYTYIWWHHRKIIEQNPNNIPNPINLYLPIIVTLISWFLLIKTTCNDGDVPFSGRRIYKIVKASAKNCCN